MRCTGGRGRLPAGQGVKWPEISTPGGGGIERCGYLLPLGAPSAELVACDEGLVVARALVRQVPAVMLSSSSVV